MNKLPLPRSGLGLAVLALAVGSTQGLARGGDEVLKQRFLQEAPSRWEEYVRLSAELQGVISDSSTGTLNSMRHHGQVEYKTDGGGKLVKFAVKHTVDGKVEQDDEEVYSSTVSVRGGAFAPTSS